MQRNQSHTAMLTEKASKFNWLRLQLLITKKQWLTDMQESFLFLSVVASFYWAINSIRIKVISNRSLNLNPNSSMVPSLLIMQIRFISHSSSLKSFSLLSHNVDIHTTACFKNVFYFCLPLSMDFVGHSPTTQFNPKRGLHLTLFLKTVSKRLACGSQVLVPSHFE